MMRGLFITGTDTGVGKTVVTCAIAAALRERGMRVAVYKPVETGCSVRDGRRIGEDCQKLASAAGGGQSAEDVVSYLLLEPAAPLVAAQAENVTIDPARLTQDFARMASSADFTLVESAGGLLVPITARYSYRDLARELGLPLLCVVGSRLGCINHALLTLEAAQAAGIAVAGYVMNELPGITDDSLAARTNGDVLRAVSRARPLGAFPAVADAAPAELARLAREHLDLETIVRCSREVAAPPC
ncbi:MAG TPA: dethiobiotin synthase [Candidatus Limnocylindrales bacterium]|nr:dethiobiotin synthase [Candidatus Limnocylindrales bacterium]